MNIDFGRPFTYVFEDPDGVKKILVGGLYAFAGLLCFIGIFALMGYQKRIIAHTADGRDVPLPEFENFLEDLVEGLKIFAIYLVFLLPAILVQMCAGVAQGVLGAEGGRDAQQLATMVGLASLCFYFPLQLAGTFIAPVGILRFIESGSLGSAFQLGEVFAFVKRNFINVLLAFVVGMAAQILASFSLLLLCVGIFFGLAWQMMVVGNAYGQVLRIDRQQRAAGVAAT